METAKKIVEFLGMSFANAVSMIRKECDPSILAAVRASGRFLYRGEDLPTDTPAALLSPPPDLLQLSTYGSRDALAKAGCASFQPGDSLNCTPTSIVGLT
jgi:hypothetical protein